MSESAAGETPASIAPTTKASTSHEASVASTEEVTTGPEGASGADAGAGEASTNTTDATTTSEGPLVEKVDVSPETKNEEKEMPIVRSVVSEYDTLITWVMQRLLVLGFNLNTTQPDNSESKVGASDKSINSVIVEFITGEGK